MYRIQQLIVLSLATTLLCGMSTHTLADDENGSKPQSARKPEVLVEIDIPRNGCDLITVPVTLKTGTYKFLLSWGSSHSVFDKSLRPLLGKPVRKQKANVDGGTTATVEFFRPPEVKIGSYMLRTDKDVACADLSIVRRFNRLRVYGVLGAYHFRDQIVRLDFDRGKLEILSRVPKDAGDTLRMRPTAFSVPTIDVKLAGRQPSRCLLGTSLFATILLHPDRFDPLASAGDVRKAPKPGVLPLAAGSMYHVTGRLGRLTVGKKTHREVGVLRGPFLGEYDAVGIAFLSRYIVVADFPEKTLYLKNGKGIDHSERDDLSGMDLVMNVKTNQIIVRTVDDNSVAKRAGLQPGDIITQINSKDAGAYSVFRLHSLRSTPGKLVMSVTRAKEVVVVTMELKQDSMSKR